MKIKKILFVVPALFALASCDNAKLEKYYDATKNMSNGSIEKVITYNLGTEEEHTEKQAYKIDGSKIEITYFYGEKTSISYFELLSDGSEKTYFQLGEQWHYDTFSKDYVEAEGKEYMVDTISDMSKEGESFKKSKNVYTLKKGETLKREISYEVLEASYKDLCTITKAEIVIDKKAKALKSYEIEYDYYDDEYKESSKTREKVEYSYGGVSVTLPEGAISEAL